MMSMGVSMDQRLEQRQEITQGQVLSYTLGVRLELMEAIRGVRYAPEATCPACNKQLKVQEILEGFNDDPRDITTLCPSCHARFSPKLIHRSTGSSMELPFYCSIQVLDQLRNLQSLTPEVIQKDYPAVYHSALVHHGSLVGAFAKIKVEYAHMEKFTWKDKVRDFLGCVPDTVIAEVVGVCTRTIANYRRRQNIPPYTKEVVTQAIHEAGLA